MKTYALLLLLLACGPSRGNDRFEGVPPGSRPSCTWDRLHPDRGQCIVDRLRFRCFREARESPDEYFYEVSCAPYKVFR